MRKKQTLIILPLVLVGVLALAGCAKKPAPDEPKNAGQSGSSPQAESGPTQQEQKIQESTEKMTVNVSYPELQGVSSAQAQSTVNNMLKSYAESLVADFKKSIKNNSYPVAGAKSTLDVTYTANYLSETLAGFEFSNSMYVEGSAHPSNEIHGLNFDLKSGKKLGLTDIFDAKSGYLKALSQKTIQNLKAKAPKDSLFDDATLKEALAPKAENFSDFVAGSDSLTFLPAPYSVAPYASGPQSVEVDYSDLTGYFATGFAKLIGK